MKDEIKKRGKETMQVGVVGITGNILLFIMKFFVGIASNSQSMLADSVNSATDVFSSIMTFIGGKISSEPSDEGHNYGHGKAEYIFTLMISVVMGFLAVRIALDRYEILDIWI